MPGQCSLIFLLTVDPRVYIFQALHQYLKGVFLKALRCTEIIFSHFLGTAAIGQLFKFSMDSSNLDFFRFEGSSFL